MAITPALAVHAFSESVCAQLVFGNISNHGRAWLQLDAATPAYYSGCVVRNISKPTICATSNFVTLQTWLRSQESWYKGLCGNKELSHVSRPAQPSQFCQTSQKLFFHMSQTIFSFAPPCQRYDVARRSRRDSVLHIPRGFPRAVRAMLIAVAF